MLICWYISRFLTKIYATLGYTKDFPLVSLLALALVSLPLVADDDKEKNAEFVHSIVLKVDGKPYYQVGAPGGSNGEFDIPGHSWVQVSKKKIIGKHYNTGPFGAPQWWSSDAADGRPEENHCQT